MVLVKTLRGIAAQIAQPIALAIGIDIPTTCSCWVGETNTLWSEPSNWDNGEVPTTLDTAVFGAIYSNPCNIDIDVSVLGIRLETGYASTITQNTTKTVTLSKEWNQCGGTFAGGDSLITMGTFIQSGGTFTSTSDELRLKKLGQVMQRSGGVFNHNGGLVRNSGSSSIWDAFNAVFNNVTFDNLNIAATINIQSDMEVLNKLYVKGGSITGSGTIKAHSDIQGGSGGSLFTSNATIEVLGTGAQKLYVDELGGKMNFCRFKITKPSGTLTVKDHIGINNAAGIEPWEYVQGTVDLTTFSSKIEFAGFAFTLDDSINTFYDLIWNHLNTAVVCTLAANITASNDMNIEDGRLQTAGFDMTAGNDFTTDRSFIELGGSSITVGGNFAASNCDLKASSVDYTLNVTGTNTADTCDIEHCDASGGTALTATTSTDSGNNTNVNFV